MCGRFNLRTPNEVVARFGFMDWTEKRIEPRFNIAPSQEILTIRPATTWFTIRPDGNPTA